MPQLPSLEVTLRIDFAQDILKYIDDHIEQLLALRKIVTEAEYRRKKASDV